jgi:urea transport system ATP-binding protein
MTAATTEREEWDDAGAGGGTRVLTEGVDTSHKGILYLEEISVSFDGFKALNALSLLIDDGELRCVIGPNGAGKTTMMDVITGKTRPDAGTVFFGQSIDLTQMTEPEIADGIGRRSKPTVFEQHTVYENLELALKTDNVWPTLRARLDTAALSYCRNARDDQTPCERADRQACCAAKQWLEIGMLLMQGTAAPARRAGRGNDRRRNHAQRRAVPVARGQIHIDRGRARHGIRAQDCAEGDGAA